MSSEVTLRSGDSPFCLDDKAETARLSRLQLLGIAGIYIGVLLASSGDTLVVAVYNSIGSDFHDLSKGAWLLVSYSLGSCISSPTFGALDELFGRKTTLLWTYFLFAAGNILCGASTSMPQLVAARVLVGLTSAGIISSSSATVTGLIPSDKATWLRSYADVANTIGRSVGAAVGFLFTKTIGWRWCFYSNVPLILLCAFIVVHQIPPDSQKSSQSMDDSLPSEVQSIDWAGIFTLTITLVQLILFIQTLQPGQIQQARMLYITGAGSIFSISIFVWIETCWAHYPLLPLNSMKKAFGGYCLSQFLILSGRTGLLTSVVPYFTRANIGGDITTLLAGGMLLVGLPFGGILANHVVRRTRHYKRLGLITIILLVLTYLVVFLRWREGIHIWEIVFLFPSGLAAGMFLATQFIGMTAELTGNNLIQCTGTYYLFQQLGRILGPAIGFALIQGNFQARLNWKLRGLPNTSELVRNILNDDKFSRTLPVPMQDVVRECYLYGFQFAALFSIFSTIAALPIVVLVREAYLD
ncbi:major facilitator superfamily domain-containing protein [Aspergillus flavus]|uniref:Major facilitator superfamily domain-containing protein n=1 Tax=Aspergillus flavus (strain ATCC 200026 / FGSC A1120 / IAM 13836 / NRRL 3357 / JCM 12722 / SRRC 167) TaxID=332952 RepID=A0A7U2MX60_ASPFN|nr:major facilitator superfamily domain-containing protein [Aspergillus flavus]